MKEIQKYFTHKDYGGYSDCIHDGDIKNLWWQGSTLSNCVGLAWGLFNLDRGTKQGFKRMTGNAGDLYAKCRPNGSGFVVGQAPKSSSIAVYGAGTKAGHVVYLLYVWRSGQAVGIESNYSGTMSNGLCLRVRLGNPRNWYKQYRGCIYDFT